MQLLICRTPILWMSKSQSGLPYGDTPYSFLCKFLHLNFNGRNLLELWLGLDWMLVVGLEDLMCWSVVIYWIRCSCGIAGQRITNAAANIETGLRFVRAVSLFTCRGRCAVRRVITWMGSQWDNGITGFVLCCICCVLFLFTVKIISKWKRWYASNGKTWVYYLSHDLILHAWLSLVI